MIRSIVKNDLHSSQRDDRREVRGALERARGGACWCRVHRILRNLHPAVLRLPKRQRRPGRGSVI